MKRVGGLILVLWTVGCGGPGTIDPDGGMSTVDGSVPALDAGSVQADAGTVDAGSPDGGYTPPSACERAAQTRTADIALLDQLRSDVAAAQTTAELDALTIAFFAAVDAQGGAPLTAATGDRVAFIARAAPQTQYSVGGSFNGWMPGVDVLTRVGQSGVWAHERTLSRSTTYAYKMVDGSTWYEDRRARHVVWDGLNRQGPGEFNALVFAELQDSSKGRLVAWRGVRSTELNDARDVFVYVPAAYDHESCPVLPSLYFHDGNEALTRAPFTEAADQTYMAYPQDAALGIYVALPDQTVRMSQYSFGTSWSTGDQYVAFLVDDLLPKIEAAFRVCPGARDRGISGASLGGLISGYAAFERPEVWSYVGSQSGSYFWENDALVNRIQSEAKKPLRWYLDHGCPNDNCNINRTLAGVLTQKGYELEHIEEAGGAHDWAYWKQRLPRLLRYFREGRSGCQ